MIRLTSKERGAAILAFGLVIAPLIFVFLTWVLVDKQNQIAGLERLRQASAVRSFLVETRRPLLNEYAGGDELYRRVVMKDDFAWFAGNFGTEADAAQGRVATLLLDEVGRPIAGSWSSKVARPNLQALFGKGLPEFLAQLMAVNHGRATISFLDSAQGPAIVQAAQIMARGVRTTGRSPAPRYLLLVDMLDRNVVDDLRAATDWSDLTIASGTGTPGRSLGLADVRGNIVGHLGWSRPTPGFVVLGAALPLLALGFVTFACGSWFVWRSIRRSSSDLVAAEQEARIIARQDPLTGLWNRRALEASLEEALTEIDDAPVYLISIDFDGFKQVNDRLGHRAGDALLVEMARRMSGVVPAGAMLARIGGDEFAVLGRGAPHEGIEIGDDIMMRIARPFTHSGQTVGISASVGVSSVGGPAADGPVEPQELLRRADVAMWEAKRMKNCMVKLWVDSMDAGRKDFQQISDEIRLGLDRGEFKVALQPLFDVASGRISGFEALARWEHPSRKIKPDEFIAVAERSRSINDLGLFILREACRKVRQFGAVSLSVNLSPVQLLDPFLVDKVARTLEETGFPPSRLELEITESYLVEQEDRALDALCRLKGLGLKISLDDFGVGYASLGYLRKFPLDKLKIDKAYVKPINGDARTRDILLAVVALGRAHGLTVTAEGVETPGQARILADAGCDILQGYLVGKPEDRPIFAVAPELSRALGGRSRLPDVGFLRSVD